MSGIFTIASDAAFLDVLADSVLAGFPLEPEDRARSPDLSAWTILTPNRRSARALALKFAHASPSGVRLLPVIHPIGDVDEGELGLPEAFDLPEAMSEIGRDLAIISLIHRWMIDNRHLALAQILAASPQQVHVLAMSLAELVDTLEVEEISLSRLPEAYNIDLAIHRESLLGLLSVIHHELPRIMMDEELLGAREKRSRIIRLYGENLLRRPSHPVIAAGTTGSIPATRDLLKIIASLPHGAVVLPGLDLDMDRKSWAEVGPQHPQFQMKTLLGALGTERKAVQLLGPEPMPRAWLASELMRPATTTDRWADSLKGAPARLEQALEGVSILKARDRKEEASAIAVAIREMLEEPGRRLAVVTADPCLLRRIRAELARWSIPSHATVGESLAAHPAVIPFMLLLAGANGKFSARALAPLLHHPATTFGLDREAYARAAQHLDLAVLRSGLPVASLPQIAAVGRFLLQDTDNKLHSHPRMMAMGDEERSLVLNFIDLIERALLPLLEQGPCEFRHCLALLETAASAIFDAGALAEMQTAGLHDVFETLRAEGRRLPARGIAQSADTLRHFISKAKHFEEMDLVAQVVLTGPLEARLVQPDTVFIAGLNEGTWPCQPDSGPWLNRPMRDILAAPLPEAQIGQMAHDFVQSFGAPRIILSYAARDGDKPISPCRWIVRLETIAKESGVAWDAGPQTWIAYAAALAEPQAFAPAAMPAPTPPVAARPRSLSVTQVDALLADPYALYAKKILKLEPLKGVGEEPSAALRGTIYHYILGQFFKAHPQRLPLDAKTIIMAIAEARFAPLLTDGGIKDFWWPRLARVAAWLVENQSQFYGGAERLHSETGGAYALPGASFPFTLTARADLIAARKDGSATIMDFKTGATKGTDDSKQNFSAQLTLQAAMLEGGAFKDLGHRTVDDIAYVRISGGVPPGEFESKRSSRADWETHAAGLARLIEGYNDASQPYLPRTRIADEEKDGYFDHLSRYREWQLAGEPS
jgi:ATP-dependent helicase/nuclease subunit B